MCVPGYSLIGCDTSAVRIPFDDLTISGESWLQNDENNRQLVAPVVLESIEVENKTGIVFRNLNMRGNLTQTGLRIVDSTVSVVDCSFSLFFEVGVECTRTTHSSKPTLKMTRCTFSGCGKGLAVEMTNVVLKDGVFMNNNEAVHIADTDGWSKGFDTYHSEIDVYGARTQFSHNQTVFSYNSCDISPAPSQLRFHLPEHHAHNPTVFARKQDTSIVDARNYNPLKLQISTVPFNDEEQRRYELSMQKKQSSNTSVNQLVQSDQPDQDVQKWLLHSLSV